MSIIKQELFDECLAYLKFGQNIHPNHVRDMIEKAYKAGYEQAIINYTEPYVERS